VQLDELFGEGRELEEEVLLGDGFGGPAAVRARVAGFGVADVELVEEAVLPGVGALVDVAVVEAAAEEVLHHLVMLGIRGALEAVDLETQLPPLLAELLGDDGGELLGGLAGGAGGALDLLAVLVGAGGQHGAVALHRLEAPHQVGHDGGVGVADVRSRVHIVDGCSQIVFHREFLK